MVVPALGIDLGSNGAACGREFFSAKMGYLRNRLLFNL
jgi:hypothetical protein